MASAFPTRLYCTRSTCSRKLSCPFLRRLNVRTHSNLLPATRRHRLPYSSSRVRHYARRHLSTRPVPPATAIPDPIPDKPTRACLKQQRPLNSQRDRSRMPGRVSMSWVWFREDKTCGSDRGSRQVIQCSILPNATRGDESPKHVGQRHLAFDFYNKWWRDARSSELSAMLKRRSLSVVAATPHISAGPLSTWNAGILMDLQGMNEVPASSNDWDRIFDEVTSTIP